MRRSAIALTLALAACMAAGCTREVKVPYPVYVEVPVERRLPDELLAPIHIHRQTDRKVGSYVETALINTSGLEQCVLQLEGIIELQP